jgi:hypothetical protein
MPASYSIDRRRGLVHSRTWGVVTSDELLDHYRRIAADPDFRPSFRQLGNMREVTAFPVSAASIACAASRTAFAPRTRRALVAPTDLAFELARMFAMYSGEVGQLVRVFRNDHEAEVWLDGMGEP